MKQSEARAKADYSLAVLDGIADKWAEDINLTAMIKNATSPMNLNNAVPRDIKAKFKNRMEANIDAIVRQAFIEGACHALCGLQDERKAMKARRIKRKDFNRAVDKIGK